ncbi:2 TM domain-containing transmembrane protein, partial [Acrasis kona]
MEVYCNNTQLFLFLTFGFLTCREQLKNNMDSSLNKISEVLRQKLDRAEPPTGLGNPSLKILQRIIYQQLLIELLTFLTFVVLNYGASENWHAFVLYGCELVAIFIGDKRLFKDSGDVIRQAIRDLLIACLERHCIPTSCRRQAAETLGTLVRQVNKSDFVKTDVLQSLIKTAGDFEVQENLRQIVLSLDPQATILDISLSEQSSLDRANARLRGAATVFKVRGWTFGWHGVHLASSGRFIAYSELDGITIAHNSIALRQQNNQICLDQLSVYDIEAFENFTPVVQQFEWPVRQNNSMVELVETLGARLSDMFDRVHEQLNSLSLDKIQIRSTLLINLCDSTNEFLKLRRGVEDQVELQVGEQALERAAGYKRKDREVRIEHTDVQKRHAALPYKEVEEPTKKRKRDEERDEEVKKRLK